MRILATISKAVAVCIGLAWCVQAPTLFLKWNCTDSLPHGLYLLTNDRNAPDIMFDVPQEKMLGLPDGWHLLKPELRANVVTLGPDGIRADGKLLPNTAPKEKASDGRKLEHYPFGTYRCDGDHVWAISTYNQRSYDSRYFGPIQQSAIIARAKPLLTF